MKKVLVTGASGALGSLVIKYLLSEGKYEITALDLRVKNSQKKLKKYRRRINIIYGDINDPVLMEALIKDQDYIIHLAGAIPPLADIKNNLSDLVEYNGTENMIKAINFYNPDIFMIYASSTTVYGNVSEASVKTKPNINELDYYSKSKLKTEKLIQDKLKNYAIIRFPLILCNPASGAFMYQVKKDTVLECITDNDAAYLLVNAINKSDKLNNKIWNAGGGDSLTTTYKEILRIILEEYGISNKYLFERIFMDYNFYGHVYKDSDELNDILEFRSDSVSSFRMRLKRQVKGRIIPKILAKPWLLFLKDKNK